MPKETFYNLKQEKRTQVEEAAIKEFSNYPLGQASVNRIIKRAKISTGSFYQYFEDIEDLYIYIINEISKKKNEYLKKEIINIKDKSFEEGLYILYNAGMLFSFENPDFYKIGNLMMNMKDKTILNKVIEDQYLSNMYNWISGMLDTAKEKGEINKNIDLELFLRIMGSINISIIEHLIKDKERLDVDELEDYSRLSIEILLYGVRGKND